MNKKLKKTPKIPKKIKKTNKNIVNFTNILLIINILLFSITIYLYLENQQLKENTKLYNTKIAQMSNKNKKLQQTTKRLEQKYLYEEKTKALDIDYTSHIDSTTYIKKKKYTFNYDENDIQSKKIEHTVHKAKKTQYHKSNKPRLAIIIDDISNQHQIDKIKAIGYKVNPSFLPPNSSRKYSAKVAAHLDHYMIHLPLQASNNRYDEKKTLHIHDSLEKIEKRILEVHRLYPKATYINNHTGSKFTANQQAMDKLYEILKKYHFNFVDSRTTAKSVSSISAKKYGVKTFRRNIFLDNKKDKKYIANQLKKAIEIAKKNGSAIAIGHPYAITLHTLKQLKYLLKDIDVVYIENL